MAKIPNCKSYDEGQCTAGTTGDNPNCEGMCCYHCRHLNYCEESCWILDWVDFKEVKES